MGLSYSEPVARLLEKEVFAKQEATAMRLQCYRTRLDAEDAVQRALSRYLNCNCDEFFERMSGARPAVLQFHLFVLRIAPTAGQTRQAQSPLCFRQ